jgi:hypothetical protein
LREAGLVLELRSGATARDDRSAVLSQARGGRLKNSFRARQRRHDPCDDNKLGLGRLEHARLFDVEQKARGAVDDGDPDAGEKYGRVCHVLDEFDVVGPFKGAGSPRPPASRNALGIPRQNIVSS